MKYSRLVEKYLDGEMIGEELRNFELEILKNPEVAEEVERLRSLNAFAKKQYDIVSSTHELLEDPQNMTGSLEESSLKNDLESMRIHKISESDPGFSDFRKKIKAVSLKTYLRYTTKNKILIPGYVIWMAAAFIAILLAFPLIKHFTTDKPENLHDIYASFYNPYRADLLLRDKAYVEDNLFKKGLNEYLNSNFGSALSYFNEVGSGNVINKSIFLLKGICLMETGDFQNAVLAFRNLTGDAVLNDYGQWYTGLCYLKLNMADEAKELFKELAGRKSYYSRMSGKVLKSM
jgi:tetratricopeptide (TPR) repeat protein